jgi:hypothetical protein
LWRDHGGEGMDGVFFFWWGARRRRWGRHVFSFGGDHGGEGRDGIFLAGSTVAEVGTAFFSVGSTVEEARTACILFWQGGRFLFLAAARRRLYGIDDEIYERADFRSAFLVATATTTINFRRDLL